METLVQEGFQNPSVPNEGTVLFQTGNLRPRIQGAEGSLRSAAYNSIMVDRGVVTFDIRPYSILNQFQSILYVRRYALYGASNNASFIASYPDWQKDVSGELFASKGMYTLPLTFDGVVKVWLQLTNYSGSTQSLAGRVLVFGRALPEYVEAEFEGQSPYHAK